jgi:hypothetical protein
MATPRKRTRGLEELRGRDRLDVLERFLPACRLLFFEPDQTDHRIPHLFRIPFSGSGVTGFARTETRECTTARGIP